MPQNAFIQVKTAAALHRLTISVKRKCRMLSRSTGGYCSKFKYCIASYAASLIRGGSACRKSRHALGRECRSLENHGFSDCALSPPIPPQCSWKTACVTVVRLPCVFPPHMSAEKRKMRRYRRKYKFWGLLTDWIPLILRGIFLCRYGCRFVNDVLQKSENFAEG